MKRTILIAVLLLNTMMINAQTATEKRIARTVALNMFDRYTTSMSWLSDRSASAENDFVNLFSPDCDSIYNDILPQNKPTFVDATTYYNIFTSAVKTCEFQYSDLQIDNPVLINNQWVVICRYSAKMNLTGRQPAMRYPLWQFHYVMRIVMDNQQNDNKLYANPRITSILVTNPVRNLAIIVNPSGMPLRFQGRYLNNYDPQCQCLVTDLGKSTINSVETDANNPFYYSTFESKGNTHTVAMERKDVFGVGVFASPYGFGNKVNLAGIKTKTNNAFHLSVFYGKNVYSDYASTLFVNLGAELTNKNLHYYGNYVEHLDSMMDSDNDIYTRNIYMNSLHERWHNFAVTGMGSVSYLIDLNRYSYRAIFLSLEAGIYGSYYFKQSLSYDIDALYTGTYPQYFNVEFDHYYDYGSDVHNESIDWEKKNNLKHRIDIGATLGIGLWFQLSDFSFLRFDISARKGLWTGKYDTFNHLPRSTAESDVNTYQPILTSSKNSLLDTYVGLSYIMLIPSF